MRLNFEETQSHGDNTPSYESLTRKTLLNKKMKESKTKKDFNTTDATRVRLTLNYILRHTKHTQSSIGKYLGTERQRIAAIIKLKVKSVKVDFEELVKAKFPQEFEDAFLIEKQEDLFSQIQGALLPEKYSKEIRIKLRELFRDGAPWKDQGLTQAEFDKKEFDKEPAHISRLVKTEEFKKQLNKNTVRDMYTYNSRFAKAIIPILKQVIEDGKAKVKTASEKYDTLIEKTDAIMQILSKSEKKSGLIELHLLAEITEKVKEKKSKAEIIDYLNNKLNSFSHVIE